MPRRTDNAPGHPEYSPTRSGGIRHERTTRDLRRRGCERPGTTLVVTTDRPPGNRLLVEPGSVRPKHVAAAVREALERGCDPHRPGSPFPLDRSAGFRSPH
ncbi:hypothetical protein [Streptomyces albidoflavus]|uniref:hypothetical protein n=1 Tax=Streptomyces albidoflavus TaxID=1886 RepID=UPI003325980B